MRPQKRLRVKECVWCERKFEWNGFVGTVQLKHTEGEKFSNVVQKIRQDELKASGMTMDDFFGDAFLFVDGYPIIKNITCKGYIDVDPEKTPELYKNNPRENLVEIFMSTFTEGEKDYDRWYISSFYANFHRNINHEDTKIKEEARALVPVLKGVGRKLLCECIGCILSMHSNFVGVSTTPIELDAVGNPTVAKEKITEAQLEKMRELHPGTSDRRLKRMICEEGLLNMYRRLGFVGDGEMKSTLGRLQTKCNEHFK